MLEISRPDISSTEVIDYPVEERFIKLPILNYLKLLDGIEPIGPQIALVNAINNPKYRAVVAALSRRTGKTFISNIIAQLIAYQPDHHVLVMAPNYSLSQISWEFQRKLLKKFDIELERANAKDKVLELINGSTIRMGSVSQADSVVGRSYDLILFDEAALDDRGEEAFNIQLRPTLDKLNSKVIFISTPRGKNWFWKFYERGFSDDFPEWVSIHSDWRENPRVSEKDIEQARKGMSDAEYRQEYLAEFTVKEGKIWLFAKENVKDISLSDLGNYDVIAGLDIGFRDATAFVVILVADDVFYIVDEYQASGKTTAEHGKAIKELIDKWDIDFVYIDSAAQQTKYDLLVNFDIGTINAKKSILDGLGYVASLVENDRVIVDKKCSNVIDTFDNYVWDTRVGLIKEKPKHDDFSHMADAIRYALYSHAHNVAPL